MKKLGKKTYEMLETIESYSCACSGVSYCYCDCFCKTDSVTYSNYYSAHMSVNNTVYTSTHNQLSA